MQANPTLRIDQFLWEEVLAATASSRALIHKTDTVAAPTLLIIR